jgi:general secretion pathway protein G
MRKNGFSFIEILVVTTIIAVLTAVGVANYRVANQKSRDGKRKGDLEQIRAALELYRTDQKAYPTIGEWPGSGGTLLFGEVIYMNDIPDDPVNDYSYVYSSDGLTYSLGAYLELAKIDESSLTGCSAESGDCNYQITNPF